MPIKAVQHVDFEGKKNGISEHTGMFMYRKLLSVLFQAAVSSSGLIPERSVWALDDQTWTSAM